MEKIYVSWTEQWKVAQYIDHYLKSRKYVVNDQSRAAIRMLIAQYPSKGPLKKSDLDFYLDANVKNIVKLEKVAKDGVVELERGLELAERLVGDLDVHQHVVRLEHLGDRVRELAASPVFDAMDHPVAGGDRVAVSLDHRGHLLALIGMHDENDLVMAQGKSPFG